METSRSKRTDESMDWSSGAQQHSEFESISTSSTGWTLNTGPWFKVRKNLAPFVPYVERSSTVAASRDSTSNLSVKLNKDWIDLSVIQSWLRTCDTFHGSHCQSVDHHADILWQGPAWLIDVQRRCLVPAQKCMKYFALSYVWGQTISTATTTENIEDLQTEDILESNAVYLPTTIKDAVNIVRVLGEQYLWVDRLCIIQNGPEKEAQLNNMAAIYANSYASIIAAEGRDATYGLKGIQNVTGPRSYSMYNQKRYAEYDSWFGNHGSNIGFLVEQARLLMDSEWYSRGWTFQEQLFSRRKIIFQDQTVNWECHCIAWHERQGCLDGQVCLPCDRKLRSDSYGFDETPWPDFYRYARLVSLYNQRQLTYPEDVMDAFVGVISTLSPKFQGGFISGLPQMFFDCALLWQPYEPLIRRRAIRQPQKKAFLPSWSWIGWQGDIDSRSWRSGYEYMRKNPDEYDEKDSRIWEKGSWCTVSTVKWHRIDEIGGKHAIQVSGHMHRGSSLEVGSLLPIGWTRHTCEISGKPFFRHECDPAQEFWYPIPLQSPLQADVSSIQTRFISCKTKRAFVREGRAPISCEISKCISVDLLDEDRNWVGVLRLPGAGWVDTKHELVELSAGFVLNQKTEEVSFDEWNFPGCPRASGKYEFYNVISVERENGVAYRKAIGRVTKAAWETIATEEIEVILG